MKKFVVADIRGELTLLEKLLQKIGPNESDCLIFTGSYLGPGSNSKGVVEHLLQLKKNLPNMSFLKGCYEFMFSSCIETQPAWETMQLWGKMGGEKVFKSYSDENIVIMKTGSNGKAPVPVKAEVSMRIPKTHLDFIENLHQWYEDDIYPYVVCHAGGHPVLMGGPLEHETQVVFSENGWWEQDGRMIPGKTVIFSHAPFKEPFRGKGKIGLDLGAGFGGKLCCFEMFEERFYTVGG